MAAREDRLISVGNAARTKGFDLIADGSSLFRDRACHGERHLAEFTAERTPVRRCAGVGRHVAREL